jgi:TPR repeat protein
MTFYAIVAEDLPVMKGVNNPVALRKAAQSNKRPPIAAIPKNLRHLLDDIWAADPARRLKFGQIAEYLSHRKHHVPGTDAKKFRAYKAFLDEGDAAIAAKKIQQLVPWLNGFLEKERIGGADLRQMIDLAGLGDFSAHLATGFMNFSGHVGPANIGEFVRSLKENEHLGHIGFALRVLGEYTDLHQGAVAEAARQPAEAAAKYRDAAKKGTREAVLRYAALLLQSGDEKSGIQLLELYAKSGDVNALCTLGDYYYRWKKDPKKALAYFRRAAVADNATDPAPWFVTGKLLCGGKQFGEARKFLEKVSQIDGEQGKWATKAKALLGAIPAAR